MSTGRKPWLAAIGASALGIAYLITPVQENTVYRAYPDPVSHGKPWTICTGHTKGVKPGDVATPAQCHQYLVEDMAVAAATVARCIRVPLNVNQAAALYDATLNEGPQVVCGSTVQREANAGNYAGMCASLARFVKAGGHAVDGLVERRVDDIELCMTPTSNPAVVYPAGHTP